MTTPAERLARNLIDFVTATAPDGPTDDTSRTALIRFADAYSLDLQDTATLFRIASGEGLGTKPEVARPGAVDPRDTVVRPGLLEQPWRDRADQLVRTSHVSPVVELERNGYRILPPPLDGPDR